MNMSYDELDRTTIVDDSGDAYWVSVVPRQPLGGQVSLEVARQADGLRGLSHANGVRYMVPMPSLAAPPSRA